MISWYRIINSPDRRKSAHRHGGSRKQEHPALGYQKVKTGVWFWRLSVPKHWKADNYRGSSECEFFSLRPVGPGFPVVHSGTACWSFFAVLQKREALGGVM